MVIEHILVFRIGFNLKKHHTLCGVFKLVTNTTDASAQSTPAR